MATCSGETSRRLPIDVEAGASSRPTFKTKILTLADGGEQRNIEWSVVRHEFDIAYGITTPEELRGVLDTFYAVNGRRETFRFRDWSDYILGTTIGTGDGSQTVFQASKVYVRECASSPAYFRTIRKLVEGTYIVYLNGVEQTSGVSVDVETGRVVFDSPPAQDVAVGLYSEFDVLVRFDSDKLAQAVTLEDAMAIEEITLMEIKDGTPPSNVQPEVEPCPDVVIDLHSQLHGIANESWEST